MLPRISRFRRKGKGGEHQVASILGDLDLVSYPEFDVGFDFFCELLENNQPSGKCFWVQVKTTQKFGEYWRTRIGKKTIALWLKQFYPVFIILYEKSSDKIYWTSVESKKGDWGHKLSNKSKTIEVTIGRTNELQKNGENPEFVGRVKQDTVLTHAVHGIPQMIGEGYVGIIPVLRLSGIARMNIRHNVRLGFDYLMYDAWLSSDLEEAYNLGKQLATFDKNHYDHFVILARICHQLGRDDEAIEYYDSAIEICKRDTRWNKEKKPSDASIEEIIETIEKEKKRKFPRKKN